MTSIAPSRSSTVAIAHTSPFLVTLRCSPLTRPPMVTCEPSARSSEPVSDAIEQSAAAESRCSTPKSGWSET